MKKLDSKLFEKNQIENRELNNILGCGVDTPCGPGYNGDKDYKDHCDDDGNITYLPCD